MTEIADTFDSAFTKAVDLGNRLADKDKDADLWDIADGLLAGALQYWLYSRQPCGDPRCQDCMPISTAEGRMAELKRLMEQLAAESEYFHTPTDANAGRALSYRREAPHFSWAAPKLSSRPKRPATCSGASRRGPVVFQAAVVAILVPATS